MIAVGKQLLSSQGHRLRCPDTVTTVWFDHYASHPAFPVLHPQKATAPVLGQEEPILGVCLDTSPPWTHGRWGCCGSWQGIMEKPCGLGRSFLSPFPALPPELKRSPSESLTSSESCPESYPDTK